jgi:hypothetical protein
MEGRRRKIPVAVVPEEAPGESKIKNKSRGKD